MLPVLQAFIHKAYDHNQKKGKDDTMEQFKLIEKIFDDKKEILKVQRKDGRISQKQMQHSFGNFAEKFKQGTVVCLKNKQVKDYFIGIEKPLKFSKKRLLERKYEEVLFFADQQLYQIEKNRLLIIPLSNDKAIWEQLAEQQMQKLTERKQVLMDEIESINQEIQRIKSREMLA